MPSFGNYKKVMNVYKKVNQLWFYCLSSKGCAKEFHY